MHQNDKITDHHDGFGLNESIRIVRVDPAGPGGASHNYMAVIRVKRDTLPEWMSEIRGAVDEWVAPSTDDYPAPAADEIDVVCARVQFQSGPRNVKGSTPGMTHMALLALLLDPLRAFQAGEFKSRHTALAITALEEALNWMHARARERAARGVLGQAAK